MCKMLLMNANDDAQLWRGGYCMYEENDNKHVCNVRKLQCFEEAILAFAKMETPVALIISM